MNNNIVKIGKALKWRGIYDRSKKYYAENIVTCYGGVFRCNVSVAQGIPPYELNEEGHPLICNSETWTCLVDTSWIVEWVLAFKKFKNDTLSRFESNEQHIAAHCERLDRQQASIESLEESVNELRVKDEEHELTMNSLSTTIGKVSEKVDKNEDDIAKINKKIGDSELTLGELQKQIAQTNQRIDEEVNGLNNTIVEQDKKIHQQEIEIEELRNMILALQGQIELLGKYNCCFSNGIWYNDLYWNNESFWNNGNGGGGNVSQQTELEVIQYIESAGELEVSGSVVQYDEVTGTLFVVDETNLFDDTTGILYVDGIDGVFQDEVTPIGYEEDEKELGVNGAVTNYDEGTGSLSVIDKTNSYDYDTNTLHIDAIF